MTTTTLIFTTTVHQYYRWQVQIVLNIAVERSLAMLFGEGGLAIWAKFDSRIPLADLRNKLFPRGLLIPHVMYLAQMVDPSMEHAISIIDSEVSNYS